MIMSESRTTNPDLVDRLDFDQATIPRRPIRLRRVATIATGVVAALLDWVLCTQLIGHTLIVDQGIGPQPVKLAFVLAAPVVAGLSGWLLLAIMERLFPVRGRAAWRIVAGGVLVLSLWSPLSTAQSASTAVWLASMHVIVGLIIIVGLAPRRR